jgi:hypothetical protein
MEEGKALRNYGIKEKDTMDARQSNIRQIDTGARTGIDGLRRLLSMSGGGVSSARNIVAPDAVARDATSKRSGAFETAGRNLRDIDLARTDARGQFKESREDIASQKRDKERSFIEGILNLQNDLNSRLKTAVTSREMAEGGSYKEAEDERRRYEDAIRSNQNALDNLFNQYKDPRYSVKPVKVRTPNLADYTVDQTMIDLAGQNPDIPEELLPYLPALEDDDSALRALLG